MKRFFLAVMLSAGITLSACSSSEDGVSCDVKVVAAPLRLDVPELTEANAASVAQHFRAKVTGPHGEPQPNVSVQFYVGEAGGVRMKDGRMLGSYVATQRSDGNGEARLAVRDFGRYERLFVLNQATSYRALADYTLCDDVVSKPAPVRFRNDKA